MSLTQIFWDSESILSSTCSSEEHVGIFLEFIRIYRFRGQRRLKSGNPIKRRTKIG
jgi:hypothetical protein